MKIVAPISSVKEIEMLIELGADELYCGFNTNNWQKQFGICKINRREPKGACINSQAELLQIVNAAHKNKIKVSVAFNSPFYIPQAISYILTLIEKLIKKISIDAVIISDINLLIALNRKKLPINIHISSLGNCFNSETANFYKEFGVKRIILPRQLNFFEIKDIIDNADKNIEFEVFAINDGCYFEEGFCLTAHTPQAFCMSAYQIKNSKFAKKKTEKQKLKNLKKELDTYLWHQNNCGSSYQENGFPNGPCSLCLFGYFKNIGITALKIVGREASFYRKMASLKIVKTVIDQVKSGATNKETAEFAKQIRNTKKYCDTGYICYFNAGNFKKKTLKATIQKFRA